MKAVIVTKPGGPENLAVAEVEDPQPGPGQVVLDVVAAGVNRADIMQRMGFYPPPPGAPEYLGLECSGTVSAVGDGVTAWSVGDQACALLAGGGCAQKVAVDARLLMPVPAGVDLVTAAALPEVACTVWSNLVMVARLAAGQVVLLHGGASGIGTMGIQVARAIGATVAVTAGSAAKLERCAELGAQILVNYREQDFVEQVRAATDGRGADVVLDNMGAKYLARNVDVLAPNGRLVIIGLQGGRRAELDLGVLLPKRGSVHATSLRVRSDAEKAQVVAATLAAVWPLVEAGQVKPVVHEVLPFARIADAHAILERSEHVGKVLLSGGWP